MTTKDEKMKGKEKRDLERICRLAHHASFAAWNGNEETALSDILLALKEVSLGATTNAQSIRNKRFSKALILLKSGLEKLENA
jgi:hypothetical protein